MHQRASDPVSAILHASRHLLRHNPALWLVGFLLGVFLALQLSLRLPSWSSTDGLTALLGFGIAGLAFSLGWLALAGLRQVWANRRRRPATVAESTEE